jgi:hypothetical protein
MICPNTTLTINLTGNFFFFLVPVIAVFTKYDQYKRDIKIKLEDEGSDADTTHHLDLDAETERIFEEQFLAHLKGSPPFVRLESEDFYLFCYLDRICYTNFHPGVEMHKDGQRCIELIEKTANELSGGAAALILLAVQKGNLELSIKQAIRR